MSNQNWTPINAAQADTLFAKHSILIGSYDRVPRFVAVDLFGMEAVKAAQLSNHNYCGVFYTDDKPFSYLTHEGFKACISYLNCKALQAQADTLHAAELAVIEADDAINNEAAEIALRLHPDMWAIVERDLKHKATKEEQAQVDAWQDEAKALVGTPEGAEILKQPAHYEKKTKKRGRPRKAA